jgi:hypothetical protein
MDESNNFHSNDECSLFKFQPRTLKDMIEERQYEKREE